MVWEVHEWGTMVWFFCLGVVFECIQTSSCKLSDRFDILGTICQVVTLVTGSIQIFFYDLFYN